MTKIYLKGEYVSPDVELVSISEWGVLCQSGGLDAGNPFVDAPSEPEW